MCMNRSLTIITMNNIFIAAIVLLNSSTIFGMEQTNKYDAWKRISLSKRWRNSNCADGAEMAQILKKFPPLDEEIKFHHTTILKMEQKENITYFLDNITVVTWPRQQQNISIAPLFFYPIVCISAPTIIWNNTIPHDTIKYAIAVENTYVFQPGDDELFKKRYGVKQQVTSKKRNYRAFSLICNPNKVVSESILKEDEQYLFGKIDTCNLGFFTGIQYEFETKTSYLFWMDPLTPSDSPHLRIELSGELKPQDFDKIYLSYAPDGTYCTFIYNNQSNTPICLVWCPRSRGTFFDEHFAKLENTYFNFK